MDQGNQPCSQGTSEPEQGRRPVLSRRVRFADEIAERDNPPALVDDDDDESMADSSSLSSLSSSAFAGDGAPHPSSPGDDAEDMDEDEDEDEDDGDDDDDDDPDMATLMCAHLELAQAAIDRGDPPACHKHRRAAWWYFRTFETCNQSVVRCPVPWCDWKFPNLCGAPKPQQRHFLARHVPLTPADIAELARAPAACWQGQQGKAWARAKVVGWSLRRHGADIPYLERLFPADMEPEEGLEWTPFQEAVGQTAAA